MGNSSDNKIQKILIAEDEESNFELLKAMLRKKPIEVFWAQNGKQAVEYCQKTEFGLILMDIKMPELNGYETISELRKMGIKTPVVAQTAYARLEDEEYALNNGFDGYVSKPISQIKLLSYIDKYL